MNTTESFVTGVVSIGGVRASFFGKVSSTLAVHIAGLILGLVQGAIVARWLGPEGKGVTAVALLVPALLGMFLNPGLAPSYVYYSASGRASTCDLVGHAVMFTGVSAALSALVLVLGVTLGLTEKLLPGIPSGLLFVSLMGFPVALLGGQLSSILLGQGRIHRLNLISLLGTVTTLAWIFVGLVLLGWGLLGVVTAPLSSGVVTVLLCCVFLGLKRDDLTPRLDRQFLRPVLAYGIRAHASNFMQFFNYRLDNFILNFLAGPASVGIYTVAVRLAELVWLLPNAVGTVIFQRASASNPEQMNTFTPRILRWTVVLTAVTGVGIALLGRLAIRVVYTEAFLEAYQPLLWLLPGTVLLGGAKVLANELAGRGFPLYNGISVGIALVVTVCLDLLLIPSYGPTGAAIASSAAYGSSFMACSLLWRRITFSSRAGLAVRSEQLPTP